MSGCTWLNQPLSNYINVGTGAAGSCSPSLGSVWNIVCSTAKLCWSKRIELDWMEWNTTCSVSLSVWNSSQKSCWSSWLESQIINIKLNKNQQKVHSPPPKLSASDWRTCGNFQHCRAPLVLCWCKHSEIIMLMLTLDPCWPITYTMQQEVAKTNSDQLRDNQQHEN